MSALREKLERMVKNRDFSLAAAESLEFEIAKQHCEDERLDELEHILASYRPGGGDFLFDETALERECIRVLNLF